MRAVALAGAIWLVASPAAAQRRDTGLGLHAGTGLELGGGSGGTVALRTPLFIDLSARTATDEQPDPIWGGSLRVEVEGRASVAVVPRAELPRRLGPLRLRAGAGIPIFFAPFTMLGVELGLTAVLDLGHGLGASAGLSADAFFAGSDVPEGSAVLMFNGAVGVELAL